MAKDNSSARAAARKENGRPVTGGGEAGGAEESQGLLLESSINDRDGSPELDIAPRPANGHVKDTAPAAETTTSPSPPPEKPRAPRRQSSFAQPRPHGTPRTPNRVRFDVIEPPHGDGAAAPAQPHPSWLDEEDYLHGDDEEEDDDDTPLAHHGRGHSQRAPLLTDIQAPSVTLAQDMALNHAEDYLETARPKSGLRSAFMNMANSIIGAGIIGQPYALRQAGLLTGVLLLCFLTVTVDWTIRLIVTNSKLSGANSFQATMEHCFGKSGLVAISVAQWAFAFGGMVAFCIIIGDTIPHVLTALVPTLAEMPVLWMLADRRTIIVIFVLGVSYPLSLYRDIAMVSFSPSHFLPGRTSRD